MIKHIAYDPASGAIAGVCNLSPSQAEAWESLGLAVAEAGSMDAQGATVGPEANYFRGGVLEAKTLVALTLDKSEISADGQDQAVVSVEVPGDTPPASIQIEVAGQAQEVELTAGVGYLPPIVTDTPTVIAVRVVDQVRYQDNGGCTITAQEA